MRFRYFTTISVLFLLSACASGPAPVPPQDPAAGRGSTAGPTPAVTEPRDDPARSGGGAVEALLADARRLRDEGDLDGCFSRLERALRIAPQHAPVYLELARSHRIAGHGESAAASAERGLLFCSGATCAALWGFLDS